MINQPEQQKQPSIDLVEPKIIINKKRRTSDEPKVSMVVKRAWHAACFAPRDRKGGSRGWRKLPGGQWMTLKVFARTMDSDVAKMWFLNKQ